MPPLRRRRGRSAAASPYSRQVQDQEDPPHDGTTLPDDALAAVFGRCHHVADVVRCAATCRRWARVVAASSAVLSHALPSPPLGLFLPPRIALGVFHQEKEVPTARTRSPMRFVPAASAGGLLPAQRPSSMLSRPVASRNGLLVVELQPECRGCHDLRLLVCNPMTGREVMLPPLSTGSSEKLRDYSCAVLTGADNDHHQGPPRSLTYLRVLLLYTRGGLAALRCYSSDTGQWGAEAISQVEISCSWKLRLTQAVVFRGAAVWPLDHGALAVRPDTLGTHYLLPYQVSHYWPERRLLGVSPDNRLFFIYFAVGDDILVAKISYFAINDGDDGFSTGRQEGSKLEEAILMYEMKMARADPHVQETLKMRWFCEKTGLVLFTLGEGSGYNGTFALNLADNTVEKVADGECDSWKNVVGYEMDVAAYLASIAPNKQRVETS